MAYLASLFGSAGAAGASTAGATGAGAAGAAGAGAAGAAGAGAAGAGAGLGLSSGALAGLGTEALASLAPEAAAANALMGTGTLGSGYSSLGLLPSIGGTSLPAVGTSTGLLTPGMGMGAGAGAGMNMGQLGLLGMQMGAMGAPRSMGGPPPVPSARPREALPPGAFSMNSPYARMLAMRGLPPMGPSGY